MAACRAVGVVLVGLAACGRVAFDAQVDAQQDAATLPGDVASFDCSGTPAIGTTCPGGAVVAGSYNGARYMVTPSGCTDSTTPSCSGGPDTLVKSWRGTGGSFTNIPGVENILGAVTATVLGDVNTAMAAAHASVTADSAIRYCFDMSFGGFDDWYLPSSSELVFVLVCHSNSPGANMTYPVEDPNCTTGGGKSSELGGFASGRYWASTESDSGGTAARRLDFGDPAVHGDNFKDQLEHVRCIRRY